MQDHYMEQLIRFPTHGANTLDLILSNRSGLISDCSSPAQLSDHDVIACTLNCALPTKRKAKRKVHLYGKGDYDSPRSILCTFKDTFLNSFSDSTPIEEDWLRLKDAMQQAIGKAVPSKILSGKDKFSWLNNQLRRLIRRMNRLHAK